MKYGFEKRQDSVNKLSKRATKKMLDDFANGKTQKYWQWLQKDPPLQWLLQNKGLAPQLAYERLAGAKEALLNAGGSENKRAESNINAFIKKLDKELGRLAKRDDIEPDKEIFHYPLMPLPEQKKDDSLDKNMKNPRELAISISSKDSSRWSEDVIYAYLAAYANNENLSAEKVRTKAINNANKKTVKTDLAEVDISVLYTWSNKLR